MSDIVKMIEELVEKKTLSLDAVNSVQALRQKALELEAQLTRATTLSESYRSQLEEARTVLARLTAREGALTEREQQMTSLEKREAVSEAKANVYADIFNRMFANRIVRENHLNQTWVPMGSQGNTYPSPIDNKNHVAREEG